MSNSFGGAVQETELRTSATQPFLFPLKRESRVFTTKDGAIPLEADLVSGLIT